MTRKQTRGKKARSEGSGLRLSKRTLKDLTPTAKAGNAVKGGGRTFTRNCPGTGA